MQNNACYGELLFYLLLNILSCFKATNVWVFRTGLLFFHLLRPYSLLRDV